MKISVFAILLLWGATWNAAQADNEDKILKPSIKTLKLLPEGNEPQRQLLYSALPLSQNDPLILEFDEVREEFVRYTVRFVRCEADWSSSKLQNTEFLDDYNEFYITDYTQSFNTKTPYLHYRFALPKLKISGNYLLQVFETDPETDLAFQKRFFIFEEKVVINSGQGMIAGTSQFLQQQNIDFTVDYQALNMPNPSTQFKVVLRQNNRWDNALQDLKPSVVDMAQKRLIFNYLMPERAFDGGNEFRMMDITNLDLLAFRVDSVASQKNYFEAFVEKDLIRQGWVYDRRYNDLNGRYFVGAKNVHDAQTQADYMLVHFFLKSPEQISEVYLLGEMTNFELREEFKMTYKAAQKGYEVAVFLKQGIYNYLYALPDPTHPQKGITKELEGSFWQTRNEYDLLVYYRPFGSRTDLLVGYRRMEQN